MAGAFARRTCSQRTDTPVDFAQLILLVITEELLPEIKKLKNRLPRMVL
jgi:hypothetical protein